MLVVPTREVRLEPGYFSCELVLHREPAIAGQMLEERVTAEIRSMIRDAEPWERGETSVGGCRSIWFETTDGIHQIVTWVVDAPGNSWVIADALVPSAGAPKQPAHDARTIGTSILRGIAIDP